MSGFWDFLTNIIGGKRKKSVFTIDVNKLKDGECKEVSHWSWKKFRNVKKYVCYKSGKLDIYDIENSKKKLISNKKTK